MLTDAKIRTAQPRDKTYRLTDFEGLYLEITPKGGRYWRMKYRFNQKEKRLAIGVYPRISLKEARKAKEEAREQLLRGIDPSAEKQRLKREATDPKNTFAGVAEAWYAKMLPGWAASTAKKRRALLNNDLLPWLSAAQIKDIRTPDVVSVLLRISDRGAIDTAHNAKQTLSQICGYAKQLGLCDYNVATDLNNILPKKKVKHRAAIIDPVEFAKLLVHIDAMQSGAIVKTALSLAPLVFQRPGELCQMEWKEIDFKKQQWVIPIEKKKERNVFDGDHIVPLSEQAIELLQNLQHLTGHRSYVFPNQRNHQRHMNPESLNKALRGLGYNTSTQQSAHGFRASARTLLDEQLHIRIEWIEQQLAHRVRSSLGRAYDRTKFLPERSEMMQRWADYLDSQKKTYLLKG